MQRQSFEKFYARTIETIANELVKQNKEFSYCSNLDGVYEEYLNQRTALRYLIKSKSMHDNETESLLLDGHKVSACITCAITKVRLITCNKIDDAEEHMYSLSESNRMNEQLAVLCGLSCLLSYMKADDTNLCLNSEDGKRVDLWFPETKYNKRSLYLDSLVRGLYYSNLLSTINPLLLSHIFFMVEQYHRKCIEFENYKNAK